MSIPLALTMCTCRVRTSPDSRNADGSCQTGSGPRPLKDKGGTGAIPGAVPGGVLGVSPFRDPAWEEWEGLTALAAWILREEARGEESPWAPDVSSLPCHVALPPFAPESLLDSLQDSELTAKVGGLCHVSPWPHCLSLAGSCLAREVARHDGVPCLSHCSLGLRLMASSLFPFLRRHHGHIVTPWGLAGRRRLSSAVRMRRSTPSAAATMGGGGIAGRQPGGLLPRMRPSVLALLHWAPPPVLPPGAPHRPHQPLPALQRRLEGTALGTGAGGLCTCLHSPDHPTAPEGLALSCLRTWQYGLVCPLFH